MYLVRTIQKTELRPWVDKLGRRRGTYLPLPVEPKQRVSGLVVLHNGRALVWRAAPRVVRVKPRRGRKLPLVLVGSRRQVAIRAKVLVYPRGGAPRVVHTNARGFTGIRYVATLTELAPQAKGAKPIRILGREPLK